MLTVGPCPAERPPSKEVGRTTWMEEAAGGGQEGRTGRQSRACRTPVNAGRERGLGARPGKECRSGEVPHRPLDPVCSAHSTPPHPFSARRWQERGSWKWLVIPEGPSAFPSAMSTLAWVPGAAP